MFGGLIARNGSVSSLVPQAHGGVLLRVRCEGVATEKPEPKDSIAINGVCLTASSIVGDTVAFDVIPESLARTSLGALKVHDVVNVEYALRVGDRMGGHFVYGHVDAAVKLLARTPEGQGVRLRLERPAALVPMLAEKAFVALDGVSLTIAAVGPEWFEVALIPETLERTTFSRRMAGDKINLEVDPIARYAVAALASR